MTTRPLRVVGACLLASLALTAPAHAYDAGWDRHEQRQVVRADLMTDLGGGFHGDRALSSAELGAALRKLSEQRAMPPVQTSSAPLTVARFDSLVVAQLGLIDLAKAVQGEAARAGLQPPTRFGTEVVARQLALRYNHPAPHEELELFPGDLITRAEAAYSLARVLSFDGWEIDGARQVLARFKLPRYSGAQLRALRVAVSKIGMPYVWGGETDGASPGQEHGGYDCSGFSWRVFKLSGDPTGRRIRGRTAAQQAGEIPKSRRVRFEDMRPADLLFFGSASFHSRASERGIEHMGIALSGDFMIHSSAQGVYVSPLFEQWRRAEFAWARRVL